MVLFRGKDFDAVWALKVQEGKGILIEKLLRETCV